MQRFSFVDGIVRVDGIRVEDCTALSVAFSADDSPLPTVTCERISLVEERVLGGHAGVQIEAEAEIEYLMNVVTLGISQPLSNEEQYAKDRRRFRIVRDPSQVGRWTVTDEAAADFPSFAEYVQAENDRRAAWAEADAARRERWARNAAAFEAVRAARGSERP